MHLQRLTAKGLVSAAESRAPEDGEKQMKISFPPAAEAVLAEMEGTLEDFEAAQLSGFTGEERAQYAQLSRRVQDHIRDIL